MNNAIVMTVCHIRTTFLSNHAFLCSFSIRNSFRMENRHLMSSNASNSVSHSLNQIETDLGSLNVNDSPLLNHTQNTPPTGPFNSRLRGMAFLPIDSVR